jgi:hypothetical protein
MLHISKLGNLCFVASLGTFTAGPGPGAIELKQCRTTLRTSSFSVRFTQSWQIKLWGSVDLTEQHILRSKHHRLDISQPSIHKDKNPLKKRQSDHTAGHIASLWHQVCPFILPSSRWGRRRTRRQRGRRRRYSRTIPMSSRNAP